MAENLLTLAFVLVDETKVGLFLLGLDRDGTLGTWGWPYIFTPINLTTRHHPLYWSLEMLFSRQCKKHVFTGNTLIMEYLH